MRQDTIKRDLLRLIAAANLAAVVACGGGGGSDTTEPLPKPPDPPPVVVTSVTVTPDAVTLQIDAERQLSATALANGQAVTGRTVAWSSGTPVVASVSATGLVRALATGTAIISATVDGRTGSATINVENPVPSLASLLPSIVTAGTGTLVITVTGSAFAGNAIVEWDGAARPTTVASRTQLTFTLAAGDLAAPGNHVVRVRNPSPGGGLSDTAMFTVRAVPVASVELAPESMTLVPGQSGELVATARDAAGSPLEGRPITWASSDSSVATIGASGTATALTAGSAIITATVEGHSDSADITVRPGGLIGSDGGTLLAGHVTLVIPPGAVTSATPFTVDNLPTPPPSADLVDGTAVELGPSGATFAQPITVQLTWTSDQEGTQDEVSRYAVHRWDGSAWVPLADHSLDAASRSVSGRTTKFSPFAVVKLPPPPEPEVHEIVFAGTDGTIGAIHPETRVRRVIIAGGADVPALSADRSRIAFVRAVGDKNQIFVVNYDGSDLRQVSDGSANEGEPSFSPDGNRIFFSRDITGGGNWKIHSMDLTGGALTQHTFAVNGVFPNDFQPRVHPAGDRIAFRRSPQGGNGYATVANLDGTNAVYVTEIGTRSPVWSPDGQRIAYHDSNGNVKVVNADGTNAVTVAHFEGSVGGVSWSPDGTQLVYHGLGESTGYQFQLFIVVLSSGEITQLTNDPSAPAYFPVWSRN